MAAHGVTICEGRMDESAAQLLLLLLVVLLLCARKCHNRRGQG
jgi:hypothetical protein